MDGKGAWRDNVFVERLWRTVDGVFFQCIAALGDAAAPSTTMKMSVLVVSISKSSWRLRLGNLCSLIAPARHSRPGSGVASSVRSERPVYNIQRRPGSLGSIIGARRGRFGCEDGNVQKTRYGLQARGG
jgi:hypothetical protein